MCTFLALILSFILGFAFYTTFSATPKKRIFEEKNLCNIQLRVWPTPGHFPVCHYGRHEVHVQCEEKCPSTQAMLVGKLWKSRKVMEQEEKK